MNTPAEIKQLLSKLRESCPDLIFASLKLIDTNSTGKIDTADFALNIFLVKVVTENRESWALEGNSLKNYKSLATKYHDLVDQGYLEPINDALVVTKKTYDLFLETINNYYPHHTKIVQNKIIFELAVSADIIQKGLGLVQSYRRNQVKAKAVVCEMGGENASLTMGLVYMWQKPYTEYNPTTQVTIYNFLDSEGGVILIAKYKKKHHVFIASWDSDLEMHAPVYFLGAVK